MVLPRALTVATALVLAALAAAPPARAHGAAVGLHVHVPDGAYRPGQAVKLEIHAKEPIRTVTLGFVGGEPITIERRSPTRHLRVKVRVPEDAKGETVGVQAEGLTAAGKTVRDAAVVRLASGP